MHRFAITLNHNDQMGHRVSQTVSSVVTKYLLDTQPGLEKVIAADNGTNVNRYVHDMTGIHSQKSGGSWSHTLQDGLGSLRAVYNSSMGEIFTAQYDPYGEVWDSTGTPQTAFGYTGEWTDQNDLIHLRARYYNPALGAFFNQDLLETPNRYNYVDNNPINMTDPSGLFAMCGISPLVGAQLGAMPGFRGFFLSAFGSPFGFGGRHRQGSQDCFSICFGSDTKSPTTSGQLSCYYDCLVKKGTLPSPMATATPSIPAPTGTVPVHTLVPPSQGFITPTAIPGAANAYYCYNGPETPNLPPGYTCINTAVDTQEEILAHVLFAEAGGSIDPETMANIAMIIWNRRGLDIVGGALNPATIVQRSAPMVNNIRDVTFSGVIKAIPRDGNEWERALGYANALMKAHVQGNLRPDFSELAPPSTGLGTSIYYCAVNGTVRDSAVNRGVVNYSEETSPGTFHIYTTVDCSEFLR